MEVTARIQAVANRVSETLRSKLQGISLSRHSSNARGGTALGSLPAKIKPLMKKARRPYGRKSVSIDGRGTV